MFCKIIWFCKHSSQLYTPSPLTLENTPSTLQKHTYRHKHKHKHKHRPSVCKDDAAAGNKHNRSRKKGLVSHQSDDDCTAIASRLQSSLRKSSPQKSESASASASATAQKKKVQWLDFFGKELVQIREFESREADDTEHEDAKGRSCICRIL